MLKKAVAPALLNIYLSIKKSDLPAEELESLLQRFPYWIKGHYQFAKVSLFAKNYEQAQASLLAVGRLASAKSKVAEQAKFLLAKCYLQIQQEDQAIAILNQLIKLQRKTEYLEELAAAYMSKEEHSKAEEILNQINKEELSLEGRSALEFLEYRKLQQATGTES